MIGQMIRRNVRARYYEVRWRPPAQLPECPILWVPNHHGWHDGYLMYLAVKALSVPTLDWIAEYDAFPLFGRIGGMPYPADDAAKRAATFRKTIRLMNEGGWSLLLFAERHLHPPPEILPFGRSISKICRAVPGSQVIPVAIYYEQSLHERPTAWIDFGRPINPEDEEDPSASAQQAVTQLLAELRGSRWDTDKGFTTLLAGTRDVNERHGLNRRR